VHTYEASDHSYNPALKEFAKKLRSSMSFSEVKLWNELKGGELMGYDFDRQKAIGNYIVDFYCNEEQSTLEFSMNFLPLFSIGFGLTELEVPHKRQCFCFSSDV
jgi:hypothetical protein